MFIKTNVKMDKGTGKRYEYYKLCEGYRIDGKVRHRIILNLGKLQGIESASDKKALADRIETLVRGSQTIFPVEIKPVIEKHAARFAHRIIQEKLLHFADQKSAKKPVSSETQTTDYQVVDLQSMVHEEVREVGAEWLCQQTLDQLDLERILVEKCHFSEANAKQAMMHIVSRAVYPASEHKTEQWIQENSAVASLFDISLAKVNRHKLYRVSNHLYSCKDILEQHLSNKTNELFDLQDKIIFYDLTNTYFEGRKEDSELAKFGRSKEKRSDAKIISMGVVVNAQGFVKHSNIYKGNISDGKTLLGMVQDLSKQTSFVARKPVVVIDSGIMTDENATLLKAKGYDYIGVSRRKLKDYQLTDQSPVVVEDKKGHSIALKVIEGEDDKDTYMYVRSEQKALKEASMNELFAQRFEEGLTNIKASLTKKSGVKKVEKVWERIGKLKQKYPRANKHYEIQVIPDQENKNVIGLTWKKKPIKPGEDHGVYFIRTNLKKQEEKTLWTIYNTLTEIEATFRVLKTDLALRPVFHQTDENTQAHLFLGLLAYQVVSTIRYQLKQQGFHHDWTNIVRIMNTQKQVTTTVRNKKEQLIRIQKCSRPCAKANEIYEALNLKKQPYFVKKQVVDPKKRI